MSGRWLNAWRATAAAVAFAAVVTGGLTPAAAHPFGDPQTVEVGLVHGRADVVRVQWKVGGLDDLTLLGVALGLLPKDRVLLDGAVFYQASDAAIVGPSDQFVDYLLRQITVSSGGTNCPGAVQQPKDLAKAGAIVDYTCPGPVGVARISVRTLTDLDPAYRTLASGPAGERTVYAAGQDSHDWVLASTPGRAAEAGQVTASTGRRAAVELGAVIGGVLLAGAAALFAVRRSRAGR